VGSGLPKKIMLEQKDRARWRLDEKPSRSNLTGSVCPAAVPPRVPTKARPANHADRRRDNYRTGLYDHASVHIATTIRATMFAAAAAFRSLGTDAREAQQSGECRHRKNLSAHLRGSFPWGLLFAADGRSKQLHPVHCDHFSMNPV
jgi:hypothetical protein